MMRKRKLGSVIKPEMKKEADGDQSTKEEPIARHGLVVKDQ